MTAIISLELKDQKYLPHLSIGEHHFYLLQHAQEGCNALYQTPKDTNNYYEYYLGNLRADKFTPVKGYFSKSNESLRFGTNSILYKPLREEN